MTVAQGLAVHSGASHRVSDWRLQHQRDGKSRRTGSGAAADRACSRTSAARQIRANTLVDPRSSPSGRSTDSTASRSGTSRTVETLATLGITLYNVAGLCPALTDRGRDSISSARTMTGGVDTSFRVDDDGRLDLESLARHQAVLGSFIGRLGPRPDHTPFPVCQRPLRPHSARHPTTARASAPRSAPGCGHELRMMASVGLAGRAGPRGEVPRGRGRSARGRGGAGQYGRLAGLLRARRTDTAFDWVTEFATKTSCKVDVTTAGPRTDGRPDEAGCASTLSPPPAMPGLGPDRPGEGPGDRSDARSRPWARSDERLQTAPWQPIDGKTLWRPYQWRPNVLMPDTEVFRRRRASWNVVFEETVLRTASPTTAACRRSTADPHRRRRLVPDGRTDRARDQGPLRAHRGAVQRRLTLLASGTRIVHRYWHDTMMQIDDFTNEGVVMFGSWPFQVDLLGQGAPIASAIPTEGAHRLGRHHPCSRRCRASGTTPMCARALDLAQAAGRSRRLVRFGPSVPARLRAIALLADGWLRRQTASTTRRDPLLAPPVAKCESQSAGSVPYYRWVTDYIAILGGGDRHRGRVPRRVAHLRRGARRRRGELRIADGEFFAMLGPSARARPPACA